MLERLCDKKSLHSTWKWENIASETSICLRVPDSFEEERKSKDDTMLKDPEYEVISLRKECERLRQLVEALTLKNQVLEKRLTGLGWSCE